MMSHVSEDLIYLTGMATHEYGGGLLYSRHTLFVKFGGLHYSLMINLWVRKDIYGLRIREMMGLVGL